MTPASPIHVSRTLRYAIPFAFIIVMAVALVLINEFTDLAFARDYAWLFITGAMLLGVWVARCSGDASAPGTGPDGTDRGP